MRVVYSSDFVGTGTVPISFTASADLAAFTGTGTFSHSINSMRDQASLQLTYNYAPIPEPSCVWTVSMALLIPIAMRPRASHN